MPSFRYPWPSSRLTPDEMAMLYHARARSPGRSITQLIAEAVRAAYAPDKANLVQPTIQRKFHDHPKQKSKPEESVPEDRAA